MGVYLDALRSTINDVQAKHITNLLKKQKDSGEIQNLEDFRAKLAQLTSQILSDKLTPSLQVFYANLNEVIDSDTYSFMLDRIRDDLESIFSESNTLDDVISSHNDIINNVALKSIKYGINQLDNKVSFYEFLANGGSFNNALFSTFSANQNNRTFRTASDAGIFFQDPRTRNILETDVTLDTIGEQILLGTNNFAYFPIKSINQIFDSEATQSEVSVAFASSDINNVIDGANGTYWTYSILQNTISSTGITAKFQLDLGLFKEINFVEIECASIYPMELVRIEYYDANNNVTNINIFNPLLNQTNKISFAAISTNKINIVVQQFNALEVQYENKQINDNFDSIAAGNDVIPNTDSIAQEIRTSVVSSSLLQNALMVAQTATPGQSVKYFDYTVGFDNIRIGFADYSTDSIYVSSSLTVNDITQIGLKAKEIRPLESGGNISNTSDTYPTTDVGYFHGSIEYYAILQNYNENNQLVDINQLALLPSNSTYINHERLVLSNKVGVSDVPNSGVLRFYTLNNTDDQKNNIKVYREGTLLTYATDWVIEDFPYTNNFVPPNGNPTTVGIRILSPKNNNFYTVSYTPLFSTTRVHPSSIKNIDLNFNDINGIKIIDLIGDGSVTMDQDNLINILSDKRDGQIITSTKINLVIILRATSSNNDLTPAVEEYTMIMNTSSE